MVYRFIISAGATIFLLASVPPRAQGSGSKRGYGASSGRRSSSGGGSHATATRSGSSPARGVKRSSSKSGSSLSGPLMVIQGNRYQKGEQLFKGKAALATGAGDPEAQRRRLSALQAQLPEHARKKSNLTAVAGKLSPAQMKDLEYFLDARYGIR